MTRRDVFDQAGGFDEELTVAFNDIDLCLKIVASRLSHRQPSTRPTLPFRVEKSRT